jgi:CxxC motif-containing protein (DUF1111 family)
MNIFKLALLFPILLFISAPSTSNAEEAGDLFDCTACHPAKIRDFKGRRANPVTPVGAPTR